LQGGNRLAVLSGFAILPSYSAQNIGIMWRTVSTFLTVLEYPVYALSGFLFPILLMPGWSRSVSVLLPPYWAALALHGTSSGEPLSLSLSVVWGLLLLSTAAAFALSWPLFRLVQRRARAQGWEVVIVSGDKDLMQLVVNGIRCYDSMYEKWYGPAEVEEKWGVPPASLPDLLALTGDKIDNIPGVPGVGEKTAAGLLKDYGSLENVLANAANVKKPKLRENLLASLDNVRRGRKLIALYDDLPLPVQLEDLERKSIDEPRARKLFTELEFVRLVTDLPRPPPTPPTGARSIATSAEDVQRLVDRRARRSGSRS